MRDLLVSVSFANLCFLKIWWDLLAPRRHELLFLNGPPKPVHFLALAINVGLVGLAVFLFRPKRAYFLLMAIPLFALRNCLAKITDAVHPFYWARHGWWAVALAAGAGLLAVATLIRYARGVSRGLPNVLAALFWLFPIFCANGAWLVTHETGWEAPALGREPAQTAGRVVWVIFDEWDYGLTFVERPADLALPEIERFAAESTAATHAYPPGGRTTISMPALLAGRLVSKVEAQGPSSAEVTLEPGSEKMPIQELAGADFPGAISGWFYPYSRLFGAHSRCFDCEAEGATFLYGSEFGEVMRNELESVAETGDWAPFGQSLYVRKFKGCYEAVIKHGVERAVDGRESFVLMHVPAPHPPYFYNRKTGRMDARSSSPERYYDQLALVDRSLGELRAAMERGGVWETTAVILSSDHGLRGTPLKGKKLDYRVPFLVKLPGKAHGTVNEGFNTVLTRDLIAAIRRNSVNDAAQ